MLFRSSEIKRAADAGVKYSLQADITKFDGERFFSNYFKYEMKEFVNALLEVDMEYVDDWDTDKLKYPVYEFSLEAYDNRIEDYSQLTDDQKKAAHPSFSACWSDGYLITASGDVLKCDTDFEKLIGCMGELEEDSYSRYRMHVWDPQVPYIQSSHQLISHPCSVFYIIISEFLMPRFFK